jgi:hypothetical protein
MCTDRSIKWKVNRTISFSMNDNYVSIISLITDDKGKRSTISYYPSVNIVNYVFSIIQLKINNKFIYLEANLELLVENKARINTPTITAFTFRTSRQDRTTSLQKKMARLKEKQFLLGWKYPCRIE